MKIKLLLCLILVVLQVSSSTRADSQIPVAAPMDTELAGRTADVAVPSVFRVLCPSKQSTGTGFLHKSGVIITAQHVISGCKPEEVLLLNFKGEQHAITNIVQDVNLDIAFLKPREKITGQCLSVSTNSVLKAGMQVSTWGFPEGYSGLAPLLTTGYISGFDSIDASQGGKIPRLVVNAAFNRGNSGGPLVEIEKGTVVGVVCSKLAPLPPYIENYLAALKKNTGTGVSYSGTKPDGTRIEIMESQILEEILQYLRSQTQLVIGYACMGEHLVQFLKSNGIEP